MQFYGNWNLIGIWLKLDLKLSHFYFQNYLWIWIMPSASNLTIRSNLSFSPSTETSFYRGEMGWVSTLNHFRWSQKSRMSLEIIRLLQITGKDSPSSNSVFVCRKGNYFVWKSQWIIEIVEVAKELVVSPPSIPANAN